MQRKARSHLENNNELSEELKTAVKSGYVTGFDPNTFQQIPVADQWATLQEVRKNETSLNEKSVAIVRERECARDPQGGREWDERVFNVRETQKYGFDAPRPLDHGLILRERERAFSVSANRVANEVRTALNEYEANNSSLGVREAALLEGRLREIRVVALQRKLRNEIWNEHVETERTNNRGGRGRTRVLKNLQRDYERMERQRMRMVEHEDRDTRRKRQLWMNACVEHANKFRSYHRDTVKRGVKAATRALLKWHDEMARNTSRAEREAERARIQKLKEDDEEGYLELVRKTKNTRVLELLNQTDKYLRDLGAVVKEERVKSGIVNYDGGAATAGNAKSSYYETAHAIKEEVKDQSSLLVGGKLKEYQMQGIQWMVSLYNNRLNGILADEMGLGKTIQTLGLITYLMEMKENAGPYLIIVPLSTIANWEQEFAKWCPAVTVIVFKGDKKARRTLFENVISKNNFNVCLVTYEYVVRGKNLLKRVHWQHLIIDEGHRIKNHESKLSVVLHTYYTSRNRLLLTGTPLQNSLTELWALLNFLLPNVFKSADSFESWFAAPFAQMGVEKVAQTEQQAQLTEEESLLIIRRLHQVLRPFLLRRLKSDVLRMGEQLPEKQEHVLICDMSAWQRYMYKQIAGHEPVLFTDRHGRRRFDKLSNPAVQFKKCVNHPYLFYSDHSNLMVDSPVLWRAAGKFDMLDGCILKFLKTGHRLLIFNQMTKVVDLQERLLRYRDIPFYRLDGNTRPEDRRDMVADFNNPDTDVNVFLLTTRAGGLGVNLQTADTVIIFDSDWNPSMDKQAQDRAHRIGQKKEVLILRMITINTIEQNVLDRADFKKGLEQKIIGAGKFDESSKDSERQEMLRELLRVEENGSEGENEEGMPTEEEINRILARVDGEYEIFQQIDKERKEEILNKPRLLTEDEIPEWATRVSADLRAKSKRTGKGSWGGDGKSLLVDSTRKRKATRNVAYNIDQLTEKQYMRLMEASENGVVGSLGEGVRMVQGKRRRKTKVKDTEPESRESTPPIENEESEKKNDGDEDMDEFVISDNDDDEDFEVDEEDEEEEEAIKENNNNGIRGRNGNGTERVDKRRRNSKRDRGASSDEGRGSRRRRIVNDSEDDEEISEEDGEIKEAEAKEARKKEEERLGVGMMLNDGDDEILMTRIPRKRKVKEEKEAVPKEEAPKQEDVSEADGNNTESEYDVGEEGEIVESP